MMKKIIPLLMAVFMTLPLLAQQSVVLGDVDDAVPGEMIDVPLFLYELDDVGAITLEIAYDGNLLEFSGFELDPSIAGDIPLPVVGFLNNRLSLQWFHQPGYNFDGQFGTFKFIYNGSFDGTLDFIETGCEIVNTDFEHFSVIYEGANVIQKTNLSIDGEASIGNASDIAGSIVQLPVSLKDLGGFDGVAENLILRVGFDNTQLVFKGIESIHLNVNHAIVDGKLIITNYNLPDDLFVNYNDETLFYLEFEYWGGGFAAVDFLPGSIITDEDGSILVTRFGGGMVVQQFDEDHGSLTISKYLSNGAVINTFDPSIIDPDHVELTITAEGLSHIDDMGLVNLVIAYDKEKLVYTGPTTAPGGWSIHHDVPSGILTLIKDDPNGFTVDGVLVTMDFGYKYLGPYDPANDIFDSQADVTFEVGTYLRKTNNTPVGPELIDGWVRLILPGDVNCDGQVNLQDILLLINYIYPPNNDLPCEAGYIAADVNGDGIITLADLLLLINIVYPPE